jgi:hypothetical protein
VLLKPFSGNCVAATDCAEVRFKLGTFPTVFSWRFLVVEELPYAFILGRDWKVAARVLVDEPHALYVRQQTSLPNTASVVATALSADALLEIPSITHMTTERCRLMQSKLAKQREDLQQSHAKLNEQQQQIHDLRHHIEDLRQTPHPPQR